MPIPPSPSVDTIMAERRAKAFTTRSIKADSKLAMLTLAIRMVDLTTLEGADTPEKVRSLCRKAVRPWERDEQVLGHRLPHVGAVCVYPSMVPHAAALLAGTGVKVASVATGFPSGQYPLSIRVADTVRAIEDGADEIDMVINRGAFLAGRFDEVASEIREIKAACVGTRTPSGTSAHLKVILETGELATLDNVRRASDLAISCIGAGDFIKTSTGKVQPAATMPVTLVMLEAIRDEYLRRGDDAQKIGMKPAGGIRTAKQAWHYLCMVQETLGAGWMHPDWFRFGASTLLNDLLRSLAKLKAGPYAAAYDFAEA